MADADQTRRDMRTPITLKIKFKSGSLDQFIERYSVDISRGGIFIRTKEPLAVGTPLKFEFQLQDASSLIGGEGTVIWTREPDPARTGVAPGMGVRFDKLTQPSQATLDKILADKAKRGEAQVESRYDAGIRTAHSTSGTLGDERDSKTPLPKPMPGMGQEESTRVMEVDATAKLASQTESGFGEESTRQLDQATVKSLLAGTVDSPSGDKHAPPAAKAKAPPPPPKPKRLTDELKVAQGTPASTAAVAPPVANSAAETFLDGKLPASVQQMMDAAAAEHAHAEKEKHVEKSSTKMMEIIRMPDEAPAPAPPPVAAAANIEVKAEEIKLELKAEDKKPDEKKPVPAAVVEARPAEKKPEPHTDAKPEAKKDEKIEAKKSEKKADTKPEAKDDKKTAAKDDKPVDAKKDEKPKSDVKADVKKDDKVKEAPRQSVPPPKKKSSSAPTYVLLGLVVASVGGYYFFRAKPEADTPKVNPAGETPTTPAVVPPTAPTAPTAPTPDPAAPPTAAVPAPGTPAPGTPAPGTPAPGTPAPGTPAPGTPTAVVAAPGTTAPANPSEAPKPETIPIPGMDDKPAAPPTAAVVEPKKNTVEVAVTSTPPGASISVDGADRGVSPVALSDLEPGKTYEIKATLKGYKDQHLKLKAKAGPLALKLVATEKLLEVTSTPSGAEVFLDGKKVGKTPAKLKVADISKEHKLQVKHAGFNVEERTVTATDAFESKGDKDVLTIAYTLVAVEKKVAAAPEKKPAEAKPAVDNAAAEEKKAAAAKAAEEKKAADEKKAEEKKAAAAKAAEEKKAADEKKAEEKKVAAAAKAEAKKAADEKKAAEKAAAAEKKAAAAAEKKPEEKKPEEKKPEEKPAETAAPATGGPKIPSWMKKKAETPPADPAPATP